MRSISSAVLSLAAMALSSMTTYLTFFDARYTLTAAMSAVSGQIQSGGGSDGTRTTAFARFYIEPAVILSNRGTRPLVLTDVELVRSAAAETCEASDTVLRTQMETIIIEPETVREARFNFELPRAQGEADAAGRFNMPGENALWCLRWTMFDPSGRRLEPVMPAFTAETSFAEPGPDDRYPDAGLDLDYPKGARRLVSRGLF